MIVHFLPIAGLDSISPVARADTPSWRQGAATPPLIGRNGNGKMIGLWFTIGAAAIAVAFGLLALLAASRGRARATSDPQTKEREEYLLFPQPVPELPASEGAMGWPFRRRGDESLRIQPANDGFHVIWRVGDDAVAHLVADREAVARGLFAWLAERFGSGEARLQAHRDAEGDERIVMERVGDAAPFRQVALLARAERGHRVVELVDGRVRSAAHAIDGLEGEELFGVLVDPRFAPQPDDPNVRSPSESRSVDAALAAVFD